VQKIGLVEFDNVNAKDPDVDGLISKLPSIPIEKVELSDFKQAVLQQKFRKEWLSLKLSRDSFPFLSILPNFT